MGVNERVILVSSQRPARLEGDTIYVIRKRGFNDVEAVSREPFAYRNFSISTSPIMQTSDVTNLVGELGGYWHVPFDTVLPTLIEENNARVTRPNN